MFDMMQMIRRLIKEIRDLGVDKRLELSDICFVNGYLIALQEGGLVRQKEVVETVEWMKTSRREPCLVVQTFLSIFPGLERELVEGEESS